MLGRLWLCWNTGKSSPISGEVDLEDIAAALGMNDFPAFGAFMRSIIHTVDDSGSDEEEDDQMTPRKGRKNKVLKDREAQKMRYEAQERREAGEAKELQFKMQIQSSGLSEIEGVVVINPAKTDDEDYVYLNPDIARKVKDHQVRGIRFMWREIVESSRKSTQGCLLAHTMGLGKTMQT